MKRILVAALMFGAIGACAAELAGTWTGQLPTRFGEIEDLTFRFARSDAGFAGKLYGEAESSPCRDLKFEGDQVKFYISTELNGGGRRVLYSGTVRGDEIEMTRRREPLPGDPPQSNRSAPQKFTLKRLF